MCGICGVYYFDDQRHVQSDLLSSITSTLIHRGPDDAGLYCDGPIGIGVRRLSILDKLGSVQPVFNEDKRLCLTCNGEIYNYRLLRDELLSKHQYHSDGDIEAIVHLYEDYGLRCVEQLRGMFAFALWDSRKHQLVLAVDRFGKKPLYYVLDNEKIIFASEIKAILRYPGISRDLDFQALDEYFANGFISAPRSIYRNIRRLKAAQIMVINHNHPIQIETYWEPNFAQPDQWDKRSLDDCADELKHLLTESVRLRMHSDVPIGAFLSGGVDSTAVVTLMTQLSTTPIKTFSVGFSDPKYDESHFAESAATYLGCDHQTSIFREDHLNLLPRLVYQFDEPFADSSMLPTYIISKMAHQQVTVVLSGDGGDEVFAGYHQHLYGYRQFILQSALPDSLYSPIVQLSRFLPSVIKAKPYLLALGRPAKHWLTSGFFTPTERNQLYSSGTQQRLSGYAAEQIKDGIFQFVGQKDLLSQLQYNDLTSYLPNDILVKVDRASMFASLEVRSPLLDHKVFEFISRLPVQYRISPVSGKKLLKKALAPMLPPFIRRRKKQGFSIPQSEWLRGKLNPLLRDLLTNPYFPGMFNQSYIQQLIQEHNLRQIDHKDRLWALLCFEIWARGQGVYD